MTQPENIAPAEGKLGILTPGMGAVATTFVAGVLAARKGFAHPTGSLTQLAHIRLGKRDEDRNPLIKDFVPLAGLDDLEFGGWDPYSDDAYAAAMKAGVLEPRHIEGIGEELRAIRPMSAVFSPRWVKNLPNTDHVKADSSHMDQAEALMEDIDRFRAEKKVDRVVAVWCGSTEAYEEPGDVHMDLDTFEQGLKDNDETITPSQVYAYACLKMGVPFANGAPNLTVDIPAMVELASRESVPIAGKDFKTGQTLMKTMIAPGLKSRMLGIKGWFSTNILGNRDGEVLDDPESFRSKEVSKLGVLEHILQPDVYPDLYGDIYHKVRINYYPPKGDDKEGWDHIDIFGWLGYPMQIKVDFLCKDSILAAP
ncbi:MAG TPA: inositol-3-phosphate synthase, partial [Acidimicrobiia bacterium]